MPIAADKNIHKFLSLLIAVVLMVPLFVKLNHFIEHQHHDICKTPYIDHFHEYNIDCDYYNFIINTYYFESEPIAEFFQETHLSPFIISEYDFFSDFKAFHSYLRGPPLTT